MRRAIQWTGENLQKIKAFIGPALIEVFEDYKGGVTLKFNHRFIYIPKSQWLAEHENGMLVRVLDEPHVADSVVDDMLGR